MKDNVRDFANEVAKELIGENFFNGEVTITVREVEKSGITLTGLMFSKAGSSISPTAYVDAAFENGIPVPKAAESLYALVKDSFGTSGQEIDLSQITDWDRAKDNLYPILVPRKGNEAYLETVASTPFLDLALIFKVKVEMEEETPEGGVASVTVTDTILKAWGRPSRRYGSRRKSLPRGLTPYSSRILLEAATPSMVFSTARTLSGRRKSSPPTGREGR